MTCHVAVGHHDFFICDLVDVDFFDSDFCRVNFFDGDFFDGDLFADDLFDGDLFAGDLFVGGLLVVCDVFGFVFDWTGVLDTAASSVGRLDRVRLVCGTADANMYAE